MELMVGQYAQPIPGHATKVWEGQLMSAWQWPQEQYDGSTATYEAIKRADTVHTVGVLPNRDILLTEDTQPHRAAVLTPAGGAVETGETVEEAAKREFLEETGFTIGELVPWHAYRAGSKIDWVVHAFVGRQLKKTTEPSLEAGEKIELRTYSFDEFLELGSSPELRDLVLRIILLEAQLDADKKDALSSLLYGS